MSDGTLVCWGRTSVTTGTVAAPLGHSGFAQVTFAMVFPSVPAIITSPEEHGGYWNSGATSVSNTGFLVTVAGDQASITINVGWLAIGRWK